MKQISKAVYAIGLVLVVMISSCEKTQTCPTGYTGANCDVAANSSFNGLWTIHETCTPSGTALPYTLTISPISNTVFDFYVVGLWEVAITVVTCNISPTNYKQFTSARQPLNGSFDIQVDNGYINTSCDTINIGYKIYTTGSATIVDQCTGVVVKN